MSQKKGAGSRPPKVVRIKIISMGNGAVGKSCVIKRYCVDFGVKPVHIDGSTVKVNFWDLSGHPEFFEVRNEFYKDTQGAILVYDVNDKKSFESLDTWMKEARKYGASMLRCVVCANKTDKSVSQRQVTESIGRSWAETRGFPYFETSAQSGKNIEKAFDTLFRAVLTKRKR
eukprot:GSMAST32.ASY1.ANO1.1960.1 assembled CDS